MGMRGFQWAAQCATKMFSSMRPVCGGESMSDKGAGAQCCRIKAGSFLDYAWAAPFLGLGTDSVGFQSLGLRWCVICVPSPNPKGNGTEPSNF